MSTGDSDNLAQNKKALKVALSVQWHDDVIPGKKNYVLNATLQTWARTLKKASTDEITCEVLKMSEDGTEVLVSFNPPPDLSKVAAAKGETLRSKDGKMLTITVVSVPGADAQTPEDGVAEAPPQPPPKPQHKREPMNEEGCFSTPAAVLTDEHLFLSEEIFQELSSTCSEEIQHIEKRNNCILIAKVKVAFVEGKGEGNQQRALSEFKALVQSLAGRAQATAIAPQRPNPEELKDAQTRNDKPDIPLLWSPLEQNRQGQSIEFPSLSGDVPPYQQKPDEVQMNINDPLFTGGITIEDSVWKLMTTSYADQLLKVQCKFGMEFSDTLVDHDKVRVTVVDDRNAALESHAFRALYRLYKRIITVPSNSSPPSGATGFTSPHTYPADPPKKVPKLHGQSGDDVAKKAPTVEAARGDDDQENNCPICLEKMKETTQLECKHAFCHKCLILSIRSMGLCCPVCKHIFGDMVGNQPDGTMTTHIIHRRLPGFSKCDTIAINYHFPSGIQTDKHPNPRMPYTGTDRKAYLPNNKEGKEVLRLLQKAFEQKLIFTIGESRTTGAMNQVTWNDIHHKTSFTGGPSNFGYPDDAYLSRVRFELKDKGIK